MVHLMLFLTFLTGPAAVSQSQKSDSTNGKPVVAYISVKSEIDPVTADFVTRSIKQAKAMQAQCLLVQLDTPGGLLESMKKIVQAFLGSHQLPIVVYVAPEGASAASAGTFITMAAHIAAMAPSTNIGAASPVEMTPGGKTTQPDTVMQKKLFNYAESYIESIAQRRDRNAKWAQSAVKNATSITAEQAVKINVVDLIAKSRRDLLNKIDGRKVAGRILHTKNARIEKISPTLAENFLKFIMRPAMVMILTLIAIFGIVGEITSPGAVIPGVTGGIALILVLYTSASLPLNVTGFALIGLAVILFIAEAFTPTFGALIAGGVISMFLGFLLLFQKLPQSMSLSWAWFIPATIITALFFIWVAGAGLKQQLTKAITSNESIKGKRAEVVDKIDERGGRIFFEGGYWNATSEEVIEEGEICEIVERQGLTIKVQSVKNEKKSPDT